MESTDYLGTNQKSYQSYMAEVRQFIDSELVRLLPAVSCRLDEQIKYAVFSPGKRLRPSLVILSAESVGGDRKGVTKLALAIELMHTASLVHDDIMDKDLMRRNISTVNAKWSISEAILVGDALFSLALSFVSDYGEKILNILASAGTALCEGEYIDTAQFAAISESDYFNRISKKCASLFKAAAQVGAIAGGGTTKEANSLAEFGESFGMAFQINDDLYDLSSASSYHSSDLWQGRMTLPLIHLYESLSECDKRHFSEELKMLGEGSAGEQNLLDEILSKVKREGSIEYCSSKMGDFVSKAIAALTPLQEDMHRIYLEQLAESLVVNNQLQPV